MAMEEAEAGYLHSCSAVPDDSKQRAGNENAADAVAPILHRVTGWLRV
eukprot:CAMPEP_0203682136 /NCGR_PEP_ID=MMETSP0090-20130426/44843_1 /ASSEMBLY_ACC=CAM_ASM_001088 /TAXON_ID=426623 /ORGANISM="Chaetoceros affinis, Strain CCMP159" /LENGTH=47 /DNA_ID= /DNA_START= /DNA_END= /DNA_ORIENTATION=